MAEQTSQCFKLISDLIDQKCLPGGPEGSLGGKPRIFGGRPGGGPGGMP